MKYCSTMKNTAKKSRKIIPVFSSVVIILMICSAFRIDLTDATEIVRKADERVKGKTSYSELTIQVIRPSWQREMGVKTWTKGNDFAIVYVTSPAKEKGNVTLKRKKEVWNWMPSIERTVKLPPSMMSQSWMGTDFTNDDFVKQSSVVNDYSQTLVGDSTVGGRSCYKIKMIPKPEAAVVWGKVIMFIDKKDFIQMRSEYYDEDGMLVNTMTGSDVKMLGGKLLPARMEMIPTDKPGQKTVIIYTTMKFDDPIEDNFFTVQNMKLVK
ncbi:outer membrane lipoprotein-sorting protein [soil metagenome]